MSLDHNHQQETDMTDHCGFCDVRRPKGGTNILIVNEGVWLEFCPPCGESEILTNKQTGEKITLLALFNRCSEGQGSLPDPAIETPRQEIPEDVLLMMGDNPDKEEFPRDAVLPMNYDRAH